jgi:hypothetical protein
MMKTEKSSAWFIASLAWPLRPGVENRGDAVGWRRGPRAAPPGRGAAGCPLAPAG